MNSETFNRIVEHLKSAPDGQLDASMRPLIEKWSNPPTALEILEVLDKCIYASLASGFVVTLLQTMYESACKIENTIHEEVVVKAVWRKDENP